MPSPTESKTRVRVYVPDAAFGAGRAVAAHRLGGGVFRILGPCPEGERWEFEPGSEVVCETCRLEGGAHELVAMRRFTAGWSVWRRDDHGNCFEIRRGLTSADAERLVGDFEARGHKQSYWLEPTIPPGQVARHP
jgi:hypothetical protein